MPIDLRMEEEVRFEAARIVGVDTTALITNDKGRAGRLAIVIVNTENDLRGGNTIEENVHLVPEAEILGSLADVEFNLGLTLARIARIDL